uniref:MULE transposase domain-containing protein n=1 Tax=Plectus sambesii TaxID=2011161 RepID=A0A914WM44_9BILA
MPSTDALKRLGRRARTKKIGVRQPVRSLADINFNLDDRSIRINGPAGPMEVNFLLHDDGPAHEERILIFGTTASLGMLTQSERLHADGTFYIVPKPFKQLYVIHCEQDGKLFPSCFCLLPGKSRAIYDRLIQIVMMLCPNIVANSVVTDFEYAAIQAFEANLPVDVSGCFFHWAQAIKKRFGSLQLSDAFKNNPLKKQYYVMIRALAFLPPSNIPAAFDALVGVVRQQNCLNDFQELSDYVEKTWVRPPRGEIKDFIGAAHPEIYVFVEELKMFFRQEEDRRRQHRAALLNISAAISPAASSSSVASPARPGFYKRRSADLKAKVLQFQNGEFCTSPVKTGLIRFLSEVADILMRRPPRGI